MKIQYNTLSSRPKCNNDPGFNFTNDLSGAVINDSIQPEDMRKLTQKKLLFYNHFLRNLNVKSWVEIRSNFAFPLTIGTSISVITRKVGIQLTGCQRI